MAKEMLDFFDENEKFVLSSEKSTKYKENSHLYFRAVYIFIVNNKKEILIQRKREDHSKLNRWEIPSGHVQSRESYEDGAKRELKEETGIITNLKYIKTIKTEKEFDAFYIGYFNILPNPKNNPEVDAFEFISFHNLIKEIENNTRVFSPSLIKFLKDYKEDFLIKLKREYNIIVSNKTYIKQISKIMLNDLAKPDKKFSKEIIDRYKEHAQENNLIKEFENPNLISFLAVADNKVLDFIAGYKKDDNVSYIDYISGNNLEIKRDLIKKFIEECKERKVKKIIADSFEFMQNDIIFRETGFKLFKKEKFDNLELLWYELEID